jgi:hypothetical protein
MSSDREILERFLRGDGVACGELLTRLRPACLLKLRRHHRGLAHAHDEIADAVETRLFEWRTAHLAGQKRFDLEESVAALAQRLAKQEAEQEGAFWRRQRAAASSEGDRQVSVADAAAGVEVAELWRAIDGLPEDLALALTAEAQRVLDGGGPLEIQLGVKPAAARKRLGRARQLLKERLWGRSKEGEDG